MNSVSNPIINAVDGLHVRVAQRSGKIFYSGPSAFAHPSPIYVLGLNPGGSPTKQVDQTVAKDREAWKCLDDDWSAYVDEAWEGKSPGGHGMQPRIRHMFDELGLDLRQVPASNVVFVRTPNEAALREEKAQLLAECWPVHEAVIRELAVTTILCLGVTAGRWVREMSGAHQAADRFVETNSRGWLSEAHVAPNGTAVITVSHPGRADWRNPAADPTPLVSRILSRHN